MPVLTATDPLFQLRPDACLALASTSPRRQELLAALGIPFHVRLSSATEELPCPGESPAAYARRMAELKGKGTQGGDCIVIAADTVVSLDGNIFGKPGCEDAALAMLERLNGRTHEVCTAVYLGLPVPLLFHEVTRVKFGSFSQENLRRYAKCGEPLDKAGAYAIQGRGAFLAVSINGSHSNVIGLPMEQLVRELLRAGIIF